MAKTSITEAEMVMARNKILLLYTGVGLGSGGNGLEGIFDFRLSRVCLKG